MKVKFGCSACHRCGSSRQVQILQRAHPPVQHQFAIGVLGKGVLDDALDRREAGAAGDEDDRLVGILAQEEAAERTFEAQDVAFLQGGKHLLGEQAARHVADVQFQQRVVVRRVGERKAARLPSFSRKSMYCPARNCRRSLAGSLIFTTITSSARLFQFLHAARQRLDQDVAGGADFPGFDDQVGQRPGAAEQRHGPGPFPRPSAHWADRRRSRPGRTIPCPCRCRRRRCGSRRAAKSLRAARPREWFRRPRR